MGHEQPRLHFYIAGKIQFCRFFDVFIGKSVKRRHLPRLSSVEDHEDMQFYRPRDLDLIQSTPLETLSLKTPPRVLTLNERPLDFLEMEQPSEEVMAGRLILRRRWGGFVMIVRNTKASFLMIVLYIFKE